MAQTTDAMSMKDCKLEMSINGTDWDDISGMSNSVRVEGGERLTGHRYTMDGDTPIIKAGKRAPLMVVANVIYTETGDEAYDEANDAYEGGTDFYLRWSPAGGDSGELQYTTGAGIVKAPVYPGGETESGDPINVDIQLEVPLISEAAVTP